MERASEWCRLANAHDRTRPRRCFVRCLDAGECRAPTTLRSSRCCPFGYAVAAAVQPEATFSSEPRIVRHDPYWSPRMRTRPRGLAGNNCR